MLQTTQITRAKLHTHERGGLTSKGGTPTVCEISHFTFCPHCDIETPIDYLNTCTYCFHPVSDDEDE
jgi:hypothetical protein